MPVFVVAKTKVESPSAIARNVFSKLRGCEPGKRMRL